MKKAVVTGHSRGIGQAVKSHLEKYGWEVQGFSRSNGFDLNQDAVVLAKKCQGVDLVFNGAPAIFGQVQFLYHAFQELKDQDSLIVNLCSNNTDGVLTQPHIHASSKKALEHLVEQLQYTPSQCRVTQLKLGYVDTARVKDSDQPKLSTNQVVDALDWILATPRHMLVRNLYISHADMYLDR